MLSQDDFTQMTDALETGSPETGALEQLPRIPARRKVLSRRRQSKLQQKQTDALPGLTAATPNARVAWRQVIQLREENWRLRFELEEHRSELRRLIAEYNAVHNDLDEEVAVIQDGHEQEIEQYQSQIREMVEERNRLQEVNGALEERYQELYHTFQDAVEEEACKMVTEAAQALAASSNDIPERLQELVKAIEIQGRQQAEKYIVESSHLKFEVQCVVEQLQHERREIEKERQKLIALQNRAREQMALRQKSLQARLRTRWKVKSTFTALGAVFLLLVLQLVFLNLSHVGMAPSISLSLIAPILFCIVLAVVSMTPASMIKQVYASAVQKKRGKNGR